MVVLREVPSDHPCSRRRRSDDHRDADEGELLGESFPVEHGGERKESDLQAVIRVFVTNRREDVKLIAVTSRGRNVNA